MAKSFFDPTRSRQNQRKEIFYWINNQKINFSKPFGLVEKGAKALR
jgi:hypothetical protein